MTEDQYNAATEQDFFFTDFVEKISEDAWDALENGNISMLLSELTSGVIQSDLFKQYGLSDITVHAQALTLAKHINNLGF